MLAIGDALVAKGEHDLAKTACFALVLEADLFR